ncbi:hypothetical protein HDU86_004763 [Geranomyces michiganensis]|nr:hypothetical protein HDU86_004763 [Geranomyces michiganensis]
MATQTTVSSVVGTADAGTPAAIATVFVGTIVHSLSLTELEILAPGIVGVSVNGRIAFIERLDADGSALTAALNRHSASSAQIKRLPAHTLLLPGLIDTHVHAPQYVFTGTGYTLPLLSWLAKYTFPQERRFSSRAHAQQMYPRAVRRSLRCGTTTAAWYGTLHVDATDVLARTCVDAGQRAFVGKVCMDRNGGEGYVEESAATSIADTKTWLDEFEALKCGDRVQPIITPRFAVSCTGELLTGLGDLARARGGLHIQTHLAENKAECAFVKELFPASESYAGVYRDHGLLTPRTVLAHCVHLSDADRKMLRDTGAGVSHCPVSNFGLDSGACNVRALLDAGCKVGLGSDVAGGWAMSIVEAMRSAIVASRVVGHVKEAAQAQEEKNPHIALSLAEAFYLATLGGAKLLDIDHCTGNFAPGKEFDALIVDLDAGGSQDSGARPVEIFDHDDAATMFEKFVFVSDDRNIREVYVAGRRVVGASEI